MVFRKPYAFLIKNFRKIHILMLFFWAFIYYKIFLLKDFVKEFISFGTYNSNLENISSKINFLFYFVVVLMILISISLMILLRYKKKPWKLYLLIIFEYIFLFYASFSTVSFFKTYDPIQPVSSIFLDRDLLNISSWIQYGILIILLLRITGLDLKKFGFNNDKEFLELNSSDREEFEINIEFDKHSITRKYNLIKRKLHYFYEEHKFIVRIAITGVVVIIAGYSYYYFAVVNKSYIQGETYNWNHYSITVENAYTTNKDSTGNVIEKNSKFVLLKIKIKNNSSSDLKPDFSRYHLMNTSVHRTPTIFYDNNFKDLGNLISDDNLLNAGTEKEFVLVYKVPNKLKDDKFVLYFQEYNGRNDTYLRKIKLKIDNVSDIKKEKVYNLNDNINIIDDKYVAFDSVNIAQEMTYNKYSCTEGNKCNIVEKKITAQNGKKIIKISFASSDYEGKEFIDFSCKYGKIKYVDNNGKVGYYNINNLINTDYEGKEIFIDVTDQILESKEIYINYVIRNNEYSIKIK